LDFNGILSHYQTATFAVLETGSDMIAFGPWHWPQRSGAATPRRRLGRRGATALEFALVSIPFLVLILGTMEVAWQLATGAALDHAALKASRFGATGTNEIPAWQRGATAAADLPTCRTTGITWLVSAATNGFIRAGSNLTVTTRTWSNLGTLTGEGAANAGTGGQITSYTIRYLQPFITGPVAAMLWGGAGFTHEATIVIKNEPFEDTTC
jgi:Flp pilus assembly protein TadG